MCLGVVAVRWQIFRSDRSLGFGFGFGRRGGLGVIRGMFGSELLLVLYLADRLGNGRAFGVLGFDRRFIFDCGFVGRLRLGVFVRLGRFPVQHLIPAPRLRRAAIAAMPARTPIPIVLIFGGALGAALFVDQGLPVGDRDLIVVRMNFAERQEAVAVAAVIDKGGLQRRLNARHFRQIDIASELFTLSRLEVEFLDAIAAQDDYPGLFRMRRVDKHFVGHCKSREGARAARSAPQRRGRTVNCLLVGEGKGSEIPNALNGTRSAGCRACDRRCTNLIEPVAPRT